MSLRARLQPALRWLPLLIILAGGAALRLDRIGELPPGLYRDEAWYGLDAVGVLTGHPALYFAANNGREGLFIYLLAAAISVFGQTTFALRVTSALVGIATLGAMYLAGRALFSHRIGVLAAGVLAGTFWHVALSRVAYRAITLPLFATLGLALAAFALRATGSRRQFLAIGAGVALGLTFYTYTSAPFLAPLILVAALVVYVRRPTDRRVILGIAGVTLAMLLPLAIWTLRHPDLYLARAGQVSILSPAINKGDLFGALSNGIEKTLGMFTLAGDRIWRHNLSLRPVFEGLTGGAFWIGIAAALWRLIRPPAAPQAGRGVHAFMLFWLAVFLVPTLLAEDAPHFLRGIGALAPACLVAAVGLEAALAYLSRRGLLANPLRALIPVGLPAVAAAGVLLLGANATRLDYFGSYVANPMTGYWLEAQNTALAAQLDADLKAGRSVRLDARLADNNPALRFLVPGLARATLVSDGAPGSVVSAASTLIVDPNYPIAQMQASLPIARTRVILGPLAQNDLDTVARRSFVAYVSETAPVPGAPPQALFANGAALVAGDLRLSSDIPNGIAVSLIWGADKPVTTDDVAFVHWMRAGRLISQSDGSPGLGYLPMPGWRPGETLLDLRTLTAPDGWQAGDELRIGLYRPSDLQRVRVVVGGRDGDDFVVLALAP
jgi:4-amino-4-deoxy-L-arabinose transferase-like glycosyltransferase